MTQTYKAGMKLSSAVCKGQIMVLRVPQMLLEITCGGSAILTSEPETLGPIDDNFKDGLLVGKRYVDENETMEFLCTRAGEGTICVNAIPLAIKQAKQLPSSD